MINVGSPCNSYKVYIYIYIHTGDVQSPITGFIRLWFLGKTLELSRVDTESKTGRFRSWVDRGGHGFGWMNLFGQQGCLGVLKLASDLRAFFWILRDVYKCIKLASSAVDTRLQRLLVFWNPSITKNLMDSYFVLTSGSPLFDPWKSTTIAFGWWFLLHQSNGETRKPQPD